MKIRLLLLLGFFFSLDISAQIPPSLSEYCNKNKMEVKTLFSYINLDFKGLDEVKRLYNENKLEEASQALLNYFEQNGKLSYFENNTDDLLSIVSYNNEQKDLLDDIFILQSVKGKQPRLPNGFLDWRNLGPNNDIEWGYFMNRHYFFDDLYSAWKNSGDKRFAEKFNLLLYDWIVSNPAPDKEEKNVVWRALEAGKRATVWPQIYQKFQSTEFFSPTVRLMMLKSLYEHVAYLRKFHRTHHNHAVMEFYGMATTALTFPEFRESENWLQYIDVKMRDESAFQLYPDGVQKELTAYYHHIVIKNLERFIKIHKAAGKSLPFLEEMLGKMYNYIAYSSTPQNFIPQNNDGDKISSGEIVQWGQKNYNRKDWEYIISNGQKGIEPDRKSIVFPWAGQVIMRNGYLPSSQYLFFDAGPWGIAHQHNDKLHFSVNAFGRDLLIDAGRYYYKEDDWRNYFNLSSGHNVILVDGKGQNRDNQLVDKALDESNYCITPKIDFAVASYDKGFGDLWKNKNEKTEDSIPGTHTRAIVYIKNKYWVVFDRMTLDKPRTISPLFHFATGCTVVSDKKQWKTSDKNTGNLLIVPVSDFNWKADLVKGRETSPIQGWFSSEYNKKEASFCLQFNHQMKKPEESFSWLIIPFEGEKAPVVMTKILSMKEHNYEIEIRINGEKEVISLDVDALLPDKKLKIIFNDQSKFMY